MAYHDIANDLTFKAFVKANALGNLVATLPDIWPFAENRINGIIAREPVPLVDERVEVFDASGELITGTGVLIEGARFARRARLYDGARDVGSVVVSRSARALLYPTGLAAIAGLGLAALVLVVLRTVPLRALRRISDALFQSEGRAGITLAAISDAVIVTDSKGHITYLNPSAASLLGCSASEVQDRPVRDIIQLQDAQSGAPLEGSYAAALRDLEPTKCKGRSVLNLPDGRQLAVEEQAAPIFDLQGRLTGIVLCLHDVSKIRELIEQRSWEATHDPLTGLFNRREFEHRVQAALADAQRSGQTHVLLYMDLDRFKIVNDSCGHAAGDRLLANLSALIQARLRESDVFARLGGDEFGLLLMGCNPEHGQRIAADIVAAVSDHVFHWNAQTFSVGMSVGLTIIGRDSINVDEVLGEADSACYRAKEQSDDRIHVYCPADLELASRRNETGWVARIQSALGQGRFVLYQQTMAGLQAGSQDRIHLEILLRLIDDDGAIIRPERFFPAAERYHLMSEIDRWVIAHTFAAFQTIAAQYGDLLPLIHINLSGASVTSNGLIDFIREQMEHHDVDPGAICFEIAEAVAIRHLSPVAEVIDDCKRLGFSLALADVGRGTNSFGYLRNLPVDYLKIDGSFVRNLATDAIDRTMTETINRIGHLMGLATIAECAENDAIVAVLREIGVDYAQGDGVDQSRPLTVYSCP